MSDRAWRRFRLQRGGVPLRWLLAGLIVAVAAVIALWPRSQDPPAGSGAPPGPDLAAARAAAGLAPCAAGTGPGALAGVRVRCLANGSAVDFAGVLAGRPVLVNVWATWCEPCRDELPVLAAYAAEPTAVAVVGLAVQSPEADALALLTRLGVRYPNVADPDGAAVRALKVPDALPASYVIETDGTVHFVTDPRLFRSVDAVRQTVARYVPPDGSGRP
jgi:thiol-disulfide isomerase/thioredoxin